VSKPSTAGKLGTLVVGATLEGSATSKGKSEAPWTQNKREQTVENNRDERKRAFPKSRRSEIVPTENAPQAKATEGITQKETRKAQQIQETLGIGPDSQELATYKESTAISGQVSSLLVFQGRINGKQARIMLDSGASHNFVDTQWIHSNELFSTTKPHPGAGTVSMANGTEERNSRFLEEATLELGKYTTKLNFDVIKVERYDAILGMKWFKEENPTIDWDAGQVIIHHQGEEVVVEQVSDHKGRIEQCTQQEIMTEEVNNVEWEWEKRVPMEFHEQAEMNLVTPTKLRQLLKKGAQMYVVHVREQKETAGTNQQENNVRKGADTKSRQSEIAPFDHKDNSQK